MHQRTQNEGLIMSANQVNVKQLIDSIEDLPTLPTVISKINQLLQNPRTSAEEVGRAIVTDQSLASKVIKLVNSAFYGFPGRINTITHAIVILGFATVKNIVLTASIIGAFNDKKNNKFNMEAFWMHSIAVGALSKTIAKEIKFKFLEEAFIAGLLHDIGKLILSQYLPQAFEKVALHCQQANCLFKEAEQLVLGVNHADIGYHLANKWNLPQDLSAVIHYHHRPEEAEDYQTITSIIHLADILARGLCIGSGGDNTIPEVDDFAWSHLALGEDKIRKILDKSQSEIEKASVFMKV
jgi:putative nucleotidyltransferase with HDIG domain